MGNEGVIRSGGVQWMKAGRGVIHSEMPEQDSGLLHGFQIWLNLPAAEKMEPAEYNDLPHALLSKDSQEQVSVISGEVTVYHGAGEVLQGPLTGRTTQPVLFDVELPVHATTELEFASDQPAQLYVYQGSINDVAQGHLALFTPGERLQLQAGKTGGHALVLSGKPLREPVVQYGPFVMNSREEIEQALRDYSTGELV